MADKGIEINFSVVDGIASDVESKLGSGAAQEYNTLKNMISVSKGDYAEALKAELDKESKMVQEVHKVLKEIAKMMEKASNDFNALDRKWSKSHIS